MNTVIDDNIKVVFETYDFILLLPTPNNQIKDAFNTKLVDYKGLIVEGEMATELLKLYHLYEFSDKIIIGSFDKPYGRKLRNLLETGVATEYELINDIILGAM